jgi:CRISPR-associated endoribonuclease Cas6
MRYYELVLSVYLKRNIYFNEINEMQGKYISSAMLKDSDLALLHKENTLKLYNFDGLYPREENKYYKEGNVYVFKIRSLDEKHINKFKQLLPDVKNEYFKLLSIEKREIKQKHILQLTTMTPVIMTDINKPMLNPSPDVFIKRLQNNLCKKYKKFYNKEIILDEPFITSFNQINEKPFAIKYKGKKLLGNKYEIRIKETEAAQKLAFVALATGLAEKNSTLGAGFCIARY